METKVCPKTWLTESILVTLFCCLPLGIVGIINATQVSSLFAQGAYDAALHKSNEAGRWTKIAFWLGLVGYIVALVVYLGAGLLGLGLLSSELGF